MQIQSVNESPPVQLTRLDSRSQKSDTNSVTAEKTGAAEDSVAFSALSERQGDARNIEAVKSSLNDVAGAFNKADAAMTAIGGHLSSMKKQLEGIVKNFPPFPPGSDDRVKLLKSFNALRQQIDELTFPPPPSGTNGAKVLADPAKVPGAGDAAFRVGNGERQVVIKAQEVHTGETGLNIPSLPDTPPADATDQQINTAISNIDTAGAVLRQRQAALADNAGEIGKSYGSMPLLTQNGSDVALSGNMPDSVALAMSNDVKLQIGASFAGLTRTDQR